jgi:gamma-glutamyltranspeptidase
LCFFSFRDLIVNKATGEFFKAGEIIKMPKLARTFEIIADEGVDAFYNGSLTKDIVADIQDNGSYLYIKTGAPRENHRPVTSH